MHLLLLATVLSLVLGASVNCRQWLARQSLPAWTPALDAPVNSLETVFFSAFTLAATTLAVVWAVLTCGRPWLRLASACSPPAFLALPGLWPLPVRNAKNSSSGTPCFLSALDCLKRH